MTPREQTALTFLRTAPGEVEISVKTLTEKYRVPSARETVLSTNGQNRVFTFLPLVNRPTTELKLFLDEIVEMRSINGQVWKKGLFSL